MEKQRFASIDDLPKILQLNSNAEPVGWIKYKDVVTQQSKGNVLWTMGRYEVLLRGGTNAVTGKQSTVMVDSIVAIDDDTSPFSYIKEIPTLSNKALFVRDFFMCAYCGNKFPEKSLTCDHVTPKSRGGKDTWDNCVAACKPCNSMKDNHLLGEIKMELLYLPYTPNFFESLILQNKTILADQMEFLVRGCHKNSRMREKFQ